MTTAGAAENDGERAWLGYTVEDDDRIVAAFAYRTDAELFIAEVGHARMRMRKLKEPKWEVQQRMAENRRR
jgi:hypothetical protein